MPRQESRASLIDKVRDTIGRYQLLNAGDRIICGLSGGPDSVCLAQMLNEIKTELQIDIVLAHVNYHKRGSDSDLDEQLCRKLASDLGLPIHVREALPQDIEAMNRHNFQNEARIFRFEYFEELHEELHAQRIAVGHTADDVVESALMHVLRGGGLRGIAGIYPKSGSAVRPLIECARAEILEYLTANKIDYRTDSSNLESEYSRNRIRNELLPHLRERFNPQIDSAIARTAYIARIAQDYIEYQANRLRAYAVSRSRLGKTIIDLDRYARTDEIIRLELLRWVQHELAGTGGHHRSVDLSLILDADRIMFGRTGERADLGSGVLIERGYSELIVFRESEPLAGQEISLPGNNVVKRMGIRIHGEFAEPSHVSLKSTDEWDVAIDPSSLSSDGLRVRCLKEGDAVRLLNAPGSKKVADILIDRKIPRALRGEIPIVANGDSIIWIIGIGIADAVKVTDQTEKALKLHAEAYVIR